MPRRPRPGEWEILYAELPAAKKIKQRLAERAVRNGRSPTAELMMILDGLLDPPDPPAPAKKGKAK